MREQLPLFAFAALASLSCTSAQDPVDSSVARPEQAAETERVEIEGGPTVVLVPVEGIGRVSMQAFYDVGFIDEPKGAAQSAHLIEHLACMGATASHAAGAASSRLNQIGIGNAETLATLTHYDYSVPADETAFAVSVEADRLRSLVIDKAIIAQEAPRCYSEVQFVMSQSPPMLGKFAMMAATQGWRHNARLANVRSGLESVPLDTLRAFHAAHYTKSSLVLVFVGSFDRDAVLATVQEQFGALPASEPAQQPIDWSRLPKEQTVQWDCQATVIYLAFPPSQDGAENLVLTALMQSAVFMMQNDADVMQVADVIDGSSQLTPIGRAPAHLAATLKPGTDPATARKVLAERFRAKIEQGSGSDSVALTLESFGKVPWSLAAADLKQQAQAMAQQAGTLERAYDLVLGNTAIQIGLREVLFGPEREKVVAEAKTIARERVSELKSQYLSGERMITTTLVPAKR